MSRYAESTSVSSDRSLSEIERTLARYGADQFSYGWENSEDRKMAVVSFRAHERIIRFVLPLPDRHDRAFTHTPTRGNLRSDAQAEDAYEQAVRQRWRALSLVVKAKLEAVEAGISTFEAEFLSAIVLPSGETVGGWIIPQVAESYRTGIMPQALPALAPTD